MSAADQSLHVDTGRSLHIDARDVLKLGRRLASKGIVIVHGALRVLGPVIESQTRRRIHDEKTAPDGTRWEPWSEDYAATRRGDQSLLMDRGHLHDSISHLVHGRALEAGSSLIYAGTHQDGTDHVPARPYLGVSRGNAREIDAVLVSYFRRTLA